MATMKKWTVDIYLDEHAERRQTRAEARLHTGDPTALLGVGTCWRNPDDPEVPEIGDELAAARALADLAAHLQAAANGDSEAVTNRAPRGW